MYRYITPPLAQLRRDLFLEFGIINQHDIEE